MGETLRDRPFVSFAFQEEYVAKCLDCVGKRDLVTEKSRDLGISWIWMVIVDWLWRFQKRQNLLVASYREDLVDSADNPNSLFWKLDFIEEHLPVWLRVEDRVRTYAPPHLFHPQMRSTIQGEAGTRRVGTAARCSLIVLDELAKWTIKDGRSAWTSTRAATLCRAAISTPYGTGNVFHGLCHKESINKVSLHWTTHPWQKRGLYTSEEGKLKILDSAYPFAKDYNFVLDGRLRSPYYDAECLRAESMLEIDQELDLQHLGSDSPFFSEQEISKVKSAYARHPTARGDLAFDSLSFQPTDWKEDLFGGRCKLWFKLPASGRPPHDRDYVLAVDVSAGTGYSDSVITVGDSKTGSKIVEFVDRRLPVHGLADYATALGRWFRGTAAQPAQIIWEHQGPGIQFYQRLCDLGYGNVYQSRPERTRFSAGRPGWYQSEQSKQAILREYARACCAGEFLERSFDCIEEWREYRYVDERKIVHMRNWSQSRPDAKGANHGDRVMASALLWRVLKPMVEGRFQVHQGDREAPYDSAQWHLDEVRREESASRSWFQTKRTMGRGF